MGRLAPEQVILKPVVTEKAYEKGEERGQYTFWVLPRASKGEIRRAVEELYKHKGVRVKGVRTLRRKGKERRYRTSMGRTRQMKRAMVTLEGGGSIDLF
jgi:large subunit ribosomal protein L23